MHQHLVDHDLEEQRRDQREELQEERGDQHFAQQTAVFVDRAQKPGDVEPARDVDSPARRVIRTSRRPTPLRARPASSSRAERQRRLDQDLVLAWPWRAPEPAIAQDRDGRQRRPGKPRPVGPVGARLEPELLGAPEHLRCADLVGSEPMPDLSAIGRDALEMQQRHEGFEPRIDCALLSVAVLTCVLQGVVAVQACAAGSATAAGSTADPRSASHHGHRPR